MTMPNSRTTTEGFHSLLHLGAMGAWADGKLVAHFLAGQGGSEVAFRVLIHRHGPMVLAACRRVLGDAHSAEDAFQATFLVLVKKAASVRGRDDLGGWLHGVALRVSKKARAQAARRRMVERGVAERVDRSHEERERAEVRAVIDEEIRRLPGRYREPLLLSYLEGLRHHEIAERLACPVGTVESRLSRARERLRSRLARRGLASTAGALGLILKPSRASAAVPNLLVEATARALAGAAPPEAVALLVEASTVAGIASWSMGGAALTGLVACLGLAVVGAGAYRARPARTPSTTGRPGAEARPSEPGPGPTEGRPPVPDRAETPRPSRPDSAVAAPLAGITIDGNLGDWPEGLERHPIRRVLRTNPDYDPMTRGPVDDPGASFRVGYDRATGRVYLAVEVRDADHFARAGSPWTTDAVEVYVDGLFSERRGEGQKPNAKTMPVIQYAGIAAPVPAYLDPGGFNPSLVYGKLSDSTTEMKYRRVGDVTTYEWAVQPFDRYPDQPSSLAPGRRVGLEVVVQDMDRDREKPAWLHWGPAPSGFKGLDASNLGELILADGP